MSRISKVWAEARDLDAVVAERLGLIGDQETWRRARAWGLVVLAILLVALLLSPVVAGGQSQSSRVATAVQENTSASFLPGPFGRSDAYSTGEDVPLEVPAHDGVLRNDYDPYGRPLQVRLRTGPQRGDVHLRPDGSFTYTPAANFAGNDGFTYDLFDQTDVNRNVSGISARVGVLSINDPPVAVADQFATPMGTALRIDAPGVLANDTDVEANPLRAELASVAGHGAVTVFASGGLFYQPDPGFVGLDSFAYTVSDGTSLSRPGQVTIEVAAVSPAPKANDDGYSTGVDEVLVVPAPGVLANDAGASSPAPLMARLDVDAEAGTVDVQQDGGFTYTPPAGFGGLDRFTYVASDGNADSPPATVTIVVGPAADAFTLGEDAFTLLEDTTLAVAAPGVLANDGVEGTARQAELLRAPAAGTVELGGDGSLIYVPDSDFTGEDSFDYVVVLGEAVSPPATVVLIVQPVEEPLPPTPPTTSAPPTTVPPAPNEAAPPPPNADAPPPPNADAPPPPNANAPPAPSVEAPVNGDAGDGAGGDQGGEGGGGAGGADSMEPVGGAVTIDVAGDLSDQTGGPPVVNLEAPPPRGDVTVNRDGTVTYVPPPEFLGRDAFGYRACTLDRTCATGRIELIVAAGPKEGSAPEVRFQKITDDGGVSWPFVALAVAAIAFAVMMAVVVVRAVRGPADPFSGADLPAAVASPGAPET